MKKMLVFGLMLSIGIVLTGCENGNLFSAFHSAGSGNYDDLMSDGDSAMKSKDYAKAAEYYKKALDKSPGNENAALGYSTALINDALGGSVITTIASDLIGDNNGGSANALFSSLLDDADKTAKLYDAVKKIEAYPCNLSDLATTLDASTNILLNAAVSQLLLTVLTVYENPLVKQYLKIDSNFEVSFGNYASLDSAKKAELKTALEAMKDPLLNNIEKSYTIINSLAVKLGTDVGGIKNDITDLKTELNSKVNELIGLL